jgi:hypothetical protein
MQKEIRLLKTSFVASWETCKWIGFSEIKLQKSQWNLDCLNGGLPGPLFWQSLPARTESLAARLSDQLKGFEIREQKRQIFFCLYACSLKELKH